MFKSGAITALILASMCRLSAQLSSMPSSIEARFSDSERVVLVTALSSQLVPEAIDSVGKLQPADYVEDVSVIKEYKENGLRGTMKVLFSKVDPMGGEPLVTGRHYVLFLLTSRNGIYIPLAAQGSSIAVRVPQQPVSSAPGIEALQDDLSANIGPNPGKTADNLTVLDQFAQLSPNTRARLSAITAEPSERSLIALLLLSRHTGVPNAYVSRTISLLATNPQLVPTRQQGAVLDILAGLSTIADIPSLVSLAHSSKKVLRLGSIEGLRRLGYARYDVLIELLNSDDVDTQYQAVMTLAETTHMSGDYAPSLDTFDRNPGKAVGLWKQWSAEHAVAVHP